MNRNGMIAALFLLPVALFATSDSTLQTAVKDAAAATKQTVASEQPAIATDTLRHFTVEELAKYDGRNNSPVYVAINDTVYDFSSIKPWNGGAHHGNKAGVDLSEKIKKSPHGTKVLKNKKVVGLLVKKSK
jgi:predicted heme/steroid binding protein